MKTKVVSPRTFKKVGLSEHSGGLHYYALKWSKKKFPKQKFGKYPYPKNVVVVSSALSKRDRIQVRRHEKFEATLMSKGMGYAEAHRKAEKKYPVEKKAIKRMKRRLKKAGWEVNGRKLRRRKKK